MAILKRFVWYRDREPSVSLTEGLIPVQLCADALADVSASGSERGLSIRCGEWHISLQGELAPTIVQMLLSVVAR